MNDYVILEVFLQKEKNQIWFDYLNNKVNYLSSANNNLIIKWKV